MWGSRRRLVCYTAVFSGEERCVTTLKTAVYLHCFSHCLRTTDKRQKATKVKCKREESLTNSLYLWNIVFSRRSIWVLLSSLADEHNTSPKSTRRHAKLDKFMFGTSWLPDSSCKHWFASSVWNFCHWVADVPPLETSPAAKSKEKRMFSQANETTHCGICLTSDKNLQWASGGEGSLGQKLHFWDNFLLENWSFVRQIFQKVD